MFNLAPKKPKPRAGQTGPGATAPIAKDAINAKRDRESARSRLKSTVSREIGPLPPVTDPARRESCRLALRLFLKTYFPRAFRKPFSKSHDRIIEKIERVILQGGLSAYAMPRGSGKTTITIGACVWALLYGYRKFISLIGANEKLAGQLLQSVKVALASPLLVADFPEVCYPIARIENDGRACVGQIINGEKTHIGWEKKKVVLPTVAGSKASGSIVTVCGLTGGIRGQIHTLQDGTLIRPDFAILDDPQTKKSAASDAQCQKLYETIMGDVLMLAGPDTKMAAVCPCTVIRKGDLADRLLDRKQSPHWQGERSKMLLRMPTSEKRWEDYAQILIDSLLADGDGREATEFYRKHRAEMDEGADPAWAEHFDADEISAIQHAMNLKFRDESAFAAECQNEPREVKTDLIQMKAEDIATRLSHLPRGIVPKSAQKITAMIDVHDELLYYVICAFEPEDFSGWVIDYATWPRQEKRYFTLRQASPSLSTAYPGISKDAAIRKGIDELFKELKSREFEREDGGNAKLDKCLIDRGYKHEIVNDAIRAAAAGSLFVAAKGVGITASGRPMNEYRPQPGEQIGTNWMLPRPIGHELRHVRHDTNSWKTHLFSRLALPLGTKGAMLLYGSKSGEHRLLIDHLLAEYGTPTEGHGRKLNEFKKKPGSPDNHLLDGVIGCIVAASMCGCGKSVTASTAPRRRPSQRGPVYMS